MGAAQPRVAQRRLCRSYRDMVSERGIPPSRLGTSRASRGRPPCGTRSVMLGNCSPNRLPAERAGCAVDTVRVSHDSPRTEPNAHIHFRQSRPLVTACCSLVRRLYHLRICHSEADSSSGICMLRHGPVRPLTAPPPSFLGLSETRPGGVSMTLG